MTPEESKKIILERVKNLGSEEECGNISVCTGIKCTECFVNDERGGIRCSKYLYRFTRKAKLKKLLG